MSRRANPQPEPHIDVDRPGELVGIDCFYVGRLRGTRGAIWQLTAIDVYSSFAWAEPVVCPNNNPLGQADPQARAPRRSELKTAGWRLERVLTDNGNEFRGLPFTVVAPVPDRRAGVDDSTDQVLVCGVPTR